MSGYCWWDWAGLNYSTSEPAKKVCETCKDTRIVPAPAGGWDLDPEMVPCPDCCPDEAAQASTNPAQ